MVAAEQALGQLDGPALDGVDVLAAGVEAVPGRTSAYLSDSQLPMASRVAGEAKFSLAISLRLARWSASSAAIAVAISGATSPTTSMAAAKASAST